MGRTVLPFSQVLSEQQQRLSKFRRALRAEDQMALDALFEQARLHIQAAVFAANPDPAEAFFVSVMIENWKLIDSLETRLNDLEKQLKAMKANHGGSAA
ncbi:MAG TPA: hypothetical protein VNH22_18905 [Blastocatellia bacterium]|jgi:uncharacterized coiled-coil protein SlyX|nr:hypothetical protein [Blastocatellia bacterium]